MTQIICSWPWIEDAHNQLDWVNSVNALENWLDEYVGEDRWHYANGTNMGLWRAVIEFERDKDTTLFRLQWQ